MAWEGSSRRNRLPADWVYIRRRVLARDQYRCTWAENGRPVCHELATEVDHIVPNDNHDMSNLRALCSFHHQSKSSAEGGAAAARRRKEINNRFRRAEAHPGLLG